MFRLPLRLFAKKIGQYARLCLIKRNIVIIVIMCTLLVNLLLLFTGYKENKRRQEALQIENVSNVIYLVEHFSTTYYSLPGSDQQFLEIIDTLTDYSKLPITTSFSPSYPIVQGFDLPDCTIVEMRKGPNSSMLKKISKALENSQIGKKRGVSFYVSCIKQWINITLPAATEINFLRSSIGVQVIITIIFIWYILSIYTLYKPWRRIKDSVGLLGIEAKSMVFPSFGPNIVKYIAKLMDTIVDRVETLLKERTLTIAALSHDIRTPLAKIRLYTELSEDVNLQNKLLPKVDQIDAYLRIVLDYAKEGYQSEKKCQLDMMALLDAVASDYIDGGLPVTVKLAPLNVILFGQPNNLQRAFMNLLDNAIKYGKKVYLEAVYQPPFGLIIKISDEGPGLPEEELEKVFQPFYRGVNATVDKAEGSGLGLAIVKNIIAYNNGNIYLKNREDGGLQAIITFVC